MIDPISLLGVGYSLVMADLAQGEKSVTRQVLGETFKSAVYGPVGNYTYDKLKEVYANLQKGDSENLNHDLQRAARKAQLTATLLAVRACLAETRRLNRNENSFWSKASGLIRKDEDEKWLNKIADLWQRKIKVLPKEPPPQIVEENQLIGLFDPKLNLAPIDIQKQLVARLKEDALAEIRHAFMQETANLTSLNLSEYASDSLPNNAAYKLLEEAIRKGWNESAEDTAHLTSLNLPKLHYRPEQKRFLINTDKQYDWFSLVCGLFNEEYKNNERVEAAMQKYLLLDIRDRQTGVPLDPKAVADLLAEHLAKFGDSFVRLEGLLKTIDAKQDGILNFVTSRFEDLARRIDKVKQTVEKTAAATQQTVVDVGGKVEQVVKEKGDELKEELRKLVIATSEEKEAREKAAIEKEKERETKRRARQSLATAGKVIGSFSFVRPTKFLDRKKEYAELQQKVFEGASPIVVIKGAGGFGKTTLAEHLLKQAAPQNKITDGRVKEIVIFNCQFGEGTLDSVITRADELLERAGAEDELRVPLREIFKQQTSDEQKILTLFEHLRRLGTIWFFFDNFESVLTAENHLEDKSLEKLLALALHANPDLRMILTTREEPLFDGCDRVATVKMEGKLPPADALAYLQQLAAEGRINWRVPPEAEEARLAELAEKLGYVPKALFSFAEYFNQKRKQPLKLSTILQSTELFADFKQHDFERGYAKLIGEQFTVLSELEQAVWKVLSVFRKPATSAAIEYMMSGYKLDDVWELLHASGLIVVQEVEVGEQVDYAYGLEQSAQDYVYQFLPADEQTEVFNPRALHEKAADYYAQTRLPEEQWKTIEDFAPQFEEMYHCRQAGLYDRAAYVLDAEAGGSLSRAGYSRRVVEERKELVSKPMSEGAKAYNSGYLANACLSLGEKRTAIRYYNEALEAYRKLKDRKNEGIALGNIGNIYSAYSDSSEKQKALEYNEQALQIHREVGNRVSEGKVLSNIGLTYANLGDMRKALEYHEQALQIHREVGNRVFEGIALGSIGRAYADLGEQQKALDYFEQALQIHRSPEIVNRVFEGRVLGNKGIAKFNLGEKQEGIRLVEQALEIARQVGEKTAEEEWLKTLKKMQS